MGQWLFLWLIWGVMKTITNPCIKWGQTISNHCIKWLFCNISGCHWFLSKSFVSIMWFFLQETVLLLLKRMVRVRPKLKSQLSHFLALKPWPYGSCFRIIQNLDELESCFFLCSYSHFYLSALQKQWLGIHQFLGNHTLWVTFHSCWWLAQAKLKLGKFAKKKQWCAANIPGKRWVVKYICTSVKLCSDMTFLVIDLTYL